VLAVVVNDPQFFVQFPVLATSHAHVQTRGVGVLYVRTHGWTCSSTVSRFRLVPNVQALTPPISVSPHARMLGTCLWATGLIIGLSLSFPRIVVISRTTKCCFILRTIYGFNMNAASKSAQLLARVAQ
jgi:hypothetical protein